MNDYINKWMYFDLFYYKDQFQEINNLEYVSPLDWDIVKNNSTNTIFECIGIENEYLKIKSRKFILRVKPFLIKGYLPKPKFKWEDKVTLITKPESNGIIDDLIWHQKDHTYYYHIILDGKRKTNRYSEIDLDFVNS